MSKEVLVLDKCMSSGKTSKVIEWMCKNPDKKWLYVSPLLSEVSDRICVDASSLDFKTPSNTDYDGNPITKTESFLLMLKEGCNISITHKLFTYMTPEHLLYVSAWGYTLIIDEEMEVIEPLGDYYNPSDIKFLLTSGCISVDEDNRGIVSWIGDKFVTEYASKYGRFKSMCELGLMFAAKRKTQFSDGSELHTFFVSQIPERLLAHATEVIVISYLFEGSLMDCYLRSLGYTINNVLAKYPELDIPNKHPSEFKPLINHIGAGCRNRFKNLSFSYSGWCSKITDKDCKDISKAIDNLGHNTNTPRENLCFSVPKKFVEGSGKKVIAPKRYPAFSKKHIASDSEEDILGQSDMCWLYSDARATNDYSHKTTMIYLMDKYPAPQVLAYVKDYCTGFNPDRYALSCLIQWLFRGCIRKGQVMNVCIISTKDKMHSLLCKWLDGENV